MGLELFRLLTRDVELSPVEFMDGPFLVPLTTLVIRGPPTLLLLLPPPGSEGLVDSFSLEYKDDLH